MKLSFPKKIVFSLSNTPNSTETATPTGKVDLVTTHLCDSGKTITNHCHGGEIQSYCDDSNKEKECAYFESGKLICKQEFSFAIIFLCLGYLDNFDIDEYLCMFSEFLQH